MKVRLQTLRAAVVAEAKFLRTGFRVFRKLPTWSVRDAALCGWMPAWLGYFVGFAHGHAAAHEEHEPRHRELEGQVREAKRELGELERRALETESDLVELGHEERKWRLRQREIDEELDKLRFLIADRLGLPASEQMEKLKRLCRDPGSGEDA